MSEYASKIMDLIRADMDAGLVPASVRSFSELHDHVDANEYLAEVPDLPDGTFDTDTINAVCSKVSALLAADSLTRCPKCGDYHPNCDRYGYCPAEQPEGVPEENNP